MNGDVKELEKPYEILDLIDGETRMFKINDFEFGKMTIFTPEKPEGKEIGALRLKIPHEQKPIGAPYYDVTSTTLIAQLKPYLDSGAYVGKTFTITKHGVAPRARFSLEVSG